MDKVYIYGTGEHARKVFQAAVLSGVVVKGFIDQEIKGGKQYQDLPIYLLDEVMSSDERGCVFIAIGNPDVRQRMIQKFLENNWQIINLIHPKSYLAPDVKMGKGIFIGAGAIIESATVIEDGVIVDVGAIIDHDCYVSKFTHIKPGIVLNSKTKI